MNNNNNKNEVLSQKHVSLLLDTTLMFDEHIKAIYI